MIRLHHGSNVGIDTIDLSLSKRGKDFGQGFYLNPSYSQALEMAPRPSPDSMTLNVGCIIKARFMYLIF